MASPYAEAENPALAMTSYRLLWCYLASHQENGEHACRCRDTNDNQKE